MKQILIICMLLAILTGCKTAYEKVNQDRYRTKSERDLLAGPCKDEFPPSYGVPIIKTGVDSTEYFAALEALGLSLDENMDLKDSILAILGALKPDSLTQKEVVADILKLTRERDSLRVIRNFIKNYKPAPIFVTTEKEVPVRDSAAFNEFNRLLGVCRDNELKAIKQSEADGKYKSYFFYTLGASILLIVLLILYLIKRLSKKVTPI